MSKQIFSIEIDNNHYSMILPNWKTDYIQGMLAKNSTPYELAMLQGMATILGEGDLVLDIGANIGNHTLYLAKVCGCSVIAFEPNRMLSSSLSESVSLNQLEEYITVINKGVGAKRAQATFAKLNPSNLGAQSLKLQTDEDLKIGFEDLVMEVIPLDSMTFPKHVKAIKIDVEGMEIDVLEGAKDIIERDRPSLFIESQDEQQFNAIYSFLEKWGYIYWFTYNATPTNWFIPADDIAQMDLQKHSLEQGRAFYKLWAERHRINQLLLKLREQTRQEQGASKQLMDLDFSLNNEFHKG